MAVEMMTEEAYSFGRTKLQGPGNISPEFMERWAIGIDETSFDARKEEKELQTDPRRRHFSATEEFGTGKLESLPLYLQEIGRIPLLTKVQEVELAMQREAGIEAQLTLAEGALNEAEETELKEKIRSGQEASRILIESNLRLVVSVSRRYIGKGVLLQDLVQEGSIGLMRAIEKFDYRRGFKLSTYATWWIRQAVTRVISDQARTIRIPVHIVESIAAIGKIATQLHQELGREPNEYEIAEEINRSEGKNLKPERIREILNIPKPLSLDTPINAEDGDGVLGDFIEDKDEGTQNIAECEILSGLLDRDLREYLSTREELVLRLRFGLKDGRMYTLGEVGAIIDVTRERARQIEAQALRKLKNNVPFKDNYRAFIE